MFLLCYSKIVIDIITEQWNENLRMKQMKLLEFLKITK